MVKPRDPETVLIHLPATKEELCLKMNLSYTQINTLLKKYCTDRLAHTWGQQVTDKGTFADVYYKTEKPLAEQT